MRFNRFATGKAKAHREPLYQDYGYKIATPGKLGFSSPCHMRPCGYHTFCTEYINCFNQVNCRSPYKVYKAPLLLLVRDRGVKKILQLRPMHVAIQRTISCEQKCRPLVD